VRVLGGRLGTEDYTELGLPGGHIGMFVSRKSQALVGRGIVDWLAARDGSTHPTYEGDSHAGADTTQP
jgi:hypothetical protein